MTPAKWLCVIVEWLRNVMGVGMLADEVRAEVEALDSASVAPGLTELAIQLAITFDENDAPTARAMVGDKLAALLVKLRALSPPASKGDAVDDIAAQRRKRRSG